MQLTDPPCPPHPPDTPTVESHAQYNLVSASLAVYLLHNDVDLGYALYPEPRWSKKVTLAAVFVGAMVGMLSMGRLGDLLGRRAAFRITLLFSMAGSLIPALAMGSCGGQDQPSNLHKECKLSCDSHLLASFPPCIGNFMMNEAVRSCRAKLVKVG